MAQQEADSSSGSGPAGPRADQAPELLLLQGQDRRDRLQERQPARRYISEKGKIRSRRITGACRRHQVQVAQAVKRAREMALLPYVAEGDDVSAAGRGGRSRRR
jgi:ribosomal protein S18